MTTVYQKRDKAFANVSAYAILKDGKHIANINLKYPKDGAGRLHCYMHIIGYQMQTASVGGYGYDKSSAVISKVAKEYITYFDNNSDIELKEYEIDLIRILATDEAHNGNWDHLLYKNGFTKINVI